MYAEELETEDREARKKAPYAKFSKSNRTSREESVGLVSRRSRTEKTISSPQTTPRSPSESSRKRRRCKAPTGPTAPIPRRRSSVPVRRKGQDLISFHRQSCRLFQSLEGTLASSHACAVETNQPLTIHGSTPDTRLSSPSIIKTDNGFAYLTSTSSTSRFGSGRISRRNSSTMAMTSPSCYDAPSPNTTTSSFSLLANTSCSILEKQFVLPFTLPVPRPHPVSVMSWTSVESRRLEYEKIDRSYRGLRGLWKRVTPRWCHGRCARRGFFDGNNGEAESVRRYRIALDGDEYENEHAGCDTGENYLNKKKKRGAWGCLSLLR